MKKLICAVLASLMLFSTVGCSTTTPDVAVTATASAAEQFLTDRLGNIPENVILGNETVAAEYGIDMSTFEDDGYILRTVGENTLVFGKTEDGLDRGVRAYVKAVEGGYADILDVVYHEGYRVERIAIAGRDISEYSIYLFEGADECHTIAATELQKYISLACGVEVPIVRQPTEYMIVYERVLEDDPRYVVLGDEGFNISVREDENLYISGGKWRGCYYGTYELLEMIGWRFAYNTEIHSNASDDLYYIYESELVEFPLGFEEEQVPSFPYRRGRFTGPTGSYPTLARLNKENMVNYGSAQYNGYGYIVAASHGLMETIEAGYINLYNSNSNVLKFLEQPCFTDEYIIEATIAHHTDTIEAKIAAGQEVGREITFIDVAQTDNSDFCYCENCYEYIILDGSPSGTALYFANAIADYFAENYPGVYVGMFAYAGTNKPPKVSVPRENVSVAYCYFTVPGAITWCGNHPLHGEDCNPADGALAYISNKEYDEEIRGWLEITSRVTVWTYPANWYYDHLPSYVFDNIYEEYKHFYELGVYGIYPCMSYAEYWSPQDFIIPFLISELCWNADITKEEYDALVEEYFTIFYGEGSRYLLEYVDWCDKVEKETCFSYYGFSTPYERIDFNKVRNDLEYCEGLIEKALSCASSAEEELAIRRFIPSVYFAWVLTSYNTLYVNGTEAEKAQYMEVYEKFKVLALEAKFTLHRKVIAASSFDVTKHPGTLYPKNALTIEWWNTFS